MNLGNVVRYWAGWNPDGESVVTADAVVTWAELQERSSRIANGLMRVGVAQGDRVGVLSGNCLEYIELVIACYKAGAILVPLNVRLTAPELRYMVDHSGCRALVAASDLAAVAGVALDASGRDVARIGFGHGFGMPFDDLRAGNDDPEVDVDQDHVAYICYTSGTTGVPKGAMLSHGNVLSMAHCAILANDVTSRSRRYLPFPLAFTGGLVSSYAPVYVAGATLVLDAAVEPERILQVIQDQRITIFNAVPVIFEMMLQHPRFDSFDLSSLEVTGSGGAAVPEALLRRLQAAGLPMSQGYGLTEGSGLSTWLHPSDAVRKLGSCGKPLMHHRVRTIEPERSDALVDVPPGEEGELIVSAPTVMLGYWEDPDATAASLVDGWLRTGDVARIDEEGYVYIVDRAKDMLISGGLNVYPAEIEAVLAAIPGVGECAVIGVPDERWGETPVALVRLLPGSDADPETIADFCRAKLADYKRPRHVVLRDSPLPRGMSGKVLKRELRDEYRDLTSPPSSATPG